MNYYDVLQNEALDLSYRLKGLEYLFENFNPESYGSYDDDAHHGVSLILKTLRKDAFEIYQCLDLVTRADAEVEFDEKKKAGRLDWLRKEVEGRKAETLTDQDKKDDLMNAYLKIRARIGG